MGYANVCVTQSKANTTGGTFADTLTANSPDSANIAVFQNGQARVLNAWGQDSDSVGEFEVICTRPQSTHDQLHGIRFNCASLKPLGAGLNGAHNFLGDFGEFQVYSGDTVTVTVTSTNA